LTGKAQIAPDGILHLDLQADGIPPGEVDVLVVIQPANGPKAHNIKELRGLGKEIWKNQDGQDYVNSLRNEWKS